MVSGPHNLFFIFSSSTSVSDSLSQVNSSVTHLTSMKNYFMIMKTYPLLKTFSDNKNSRVLLFIFVLNFLKCFSFKLSQHFCIAGEIQNFPTTSPCHLTSPCRSPAARGTPFLRGTFFFLPGEFVSRLNSRRLVCQGSKAARQQGSKQASQPASQPASQQASKPASKQASKGACEQTKQASQQASQPGNQQLHHCATVPLKILLPWRVGGDGWS